MKCSYKRIVVSIDKEYKNFYSLGTTEIRLQRDTDNFDRKYTQPVNGIVIDAENIPIGAEVLLHHNASHDTYYIFDYEEDKQLFSIPETECYAWRTDGEWHPSNGFELALRVFKPYKGFLNSILPEKIKQKLFITSGVFKNKVVVTLKFCDYEIIFRDKDGTEQSIIRCRNSKERKEIIAVDLGATEKVLKGEWFVGINNENCHPLNYKLCQLMEN